jgi:hypothetical protein
MRPRCHDWGTAARAAAVRTDTAPTPGQLLRASSFLGVHLQCINPIYPLVKEPDAVQTQRRRRCFTESSVEPLPSATLAERHRSVHGEPSSVPICHRLSRRHSPHGQAFCTPAVIAPVPPMPSSRSSRTLKPSRTTSCHMGRRCRRRLDIGKSGRHLQPRLDYRPLRRVFHQVCPTPQIGCTRPDRDRIRITPCPTPQCGKRRSPRGGASSPRVRASVAAPASGSVGSGDHLEVFSTPGTPMPGTPSHRNHPTVSPGHPAASRSTLFAQRSTLHTHAPHLTLRL